MNSVMRVEAPHNMLWVVSQARASVLNLEVTASRYVDGEAQASELNRHYQVFLSRIHLLQQGPQQQEVEADRKSTRLNSSHVRISYAVFCLKKKKINLY